MINIEETITDIVNTLSDLISLKPGVYKATVANTIDEFNISTPNAGKIQVICPDVYGVDSNGVFVLSPYCEPAFQSPHDFFVPEIGQSVWIMFEHGDPKAPIWFGSFPTIDQIKVKEFSNVPNESVFLEDEEKEGLPLSAVNKLPVKEGETKQIGGIIEEAIDRVIGSRFGSYLKFDDRNKEIVLELLGATAVDRDRVGPSLTMSFAFDDSTPTDIAKNFSKLNVELPFGKDSKEDPATADKTELLLTNNSLDLKIRSIDSSSAKFSLNVDATDDGGGKVTIKVANNKSVIVIEKDGKMTITNAGDTKLDVTGKIDLKATGNITVDSQGANLTLKTGDATAWKPNTLVNCLFTGAPHSVGVTKLLGG
jgi:hypothetical protein